MNKTIILKNNGKYIELPYGRDKHFDVDLKVDKNASNILKFTNDEIHINDVAFSDNEIHLDGLDGTVFESAQTEYALGDNGVLKVGAKAQNDIVIENASGEMLFSNGDLIIMSGNVYINGILFNGERCAISEEDCVYTGNVKMYFKRFSVVCDGSGYSSKLLELIKDTDMAEDYPQYKRSPRIIKRAPTDSIDISNPPTKPEKNKGAWMTILMPIIMVGITIAIGVFMKRGWLVLMSAAMMFSSAVFAIVRVVSDRKSFKEKRVKRIKDYKEYLLRVRKRLDGLYQDQKTALLYHNPTVSQIEKMVKERSGRIYEHAYNDGDFLCFPIGRSVVNSSYSIKYNSNTLEDSGDGLLQDMRSVVSSFTTISDMPFVIDLKRTHFAYVGEKENIHLQIKALIAQLAFFQSYHDVNIVLLTDEQSRQEFEWMRWLPHCRLKSINTLTIISTENHRDKVLGNITSQIKERKMNKDEKKKNSIYIPHYVFIIDNPKLIMSHSIMEYLQSEELDLGFSVVFSTHLKSNVPENIKTVLLLNSKEQGTLLLKEGQYMNRPISFDTNENVAYEDIARGLCPIVHNKGVTTQIPDTITFFEMYGIKKPEDLPIEQLWGKSACYKSLAVPVGARAKDDYVYLNLHEKAHGPHGLVAGTTGSGKSEALQSYILSLAINFHPYDVGFLLIDYKGGGMAKMFENLPHLLGIITNLDGSESMRALASIKSELARRQRVFNENDVNNINDYTKLFKAGTAKEPLPHLFIISDEFAELKKEQPEFMKELVSTARIGRSLGVHLILATQKPTGVVDDQIWSNSRFKLALKVQDESDSKEILKTPDAARITKSGQAYLQIGNNEIYELFQTAWSGASYGKNETEETFDERIYLENSFGQGELLNADLADMHIEGNSMVTQLDVLVDRIAEVYNETDAVPVAKPWLPSLPDNLVSPHIGTSVDVGKIQDYDMSIPIGLVDIPENQEQTEFVHDFFKDGNLAFFGASGYGKSVGMITSTLELATKNSPEFVQFYTLDFGNSSLIQLKGLPHMADYMTFDDSEKLKKLTVILTAEMAERKRLFAKENAISFKMYNQTADKKLPAIIVEIDNYDVVKEIGMDLDEFILKLSRDGTGVGIYTIISASRSNAVRYSTLNNFKTKVALYSFDPSDITALVGRSNYKLTEVRGRALVKLKEPHIMQCYLPAEYDNDMDYSARIKEIINTVAENNSAISAKGIPVLPEVLDANMLEKSKKTKSVAVGLEAETVQTQFMDLSIPVQLIVGNSKTGKTNLLKLIASQLKKASLFLSDAKSMELHEMRKEKNVIMFSDAEKFIEKLGMTVKHRGEQYEQSDKSLIPKDFYSKLEPTYLLIDDVDNFIDSVKNIAKEANELVCKLEDVGISIIATTTPNRLRGFDDITKYIKATQSGIVLGNPNEQTLLNVDVERGYKSRIDIGFIIDRGITYKTMIPKV